MSEEPHYIVVGGTNIRRCATALNIGTPNIYDTIELAQVAIDEEENLRKKHNRPKHHTFVPISVKEYDEKYPKSAED